MNPQIASLCNGPWQRQKDNLYFFGKSADIETGVRTRQEQITGTENSEFDLRLSVKLTFLATSKTYVDTF